MKKRSALLAAAVLLGALLVPAAPVGAQSGDSLVTNGSPTGPFSANKQNEPAVAIDAAHPNVVVAGSNDNIDMEHCNAGTDNTCPFTDGVGVSGVYFSFDSGKTWVQPTYQGLTARNCVGAPGDNDPPCTPQIGPIGTLPNYNTHGLVSDGDPAVAFGPAPGPGGFSWDNGSRLYYANLTSNCGSPCGTGQAFKGFEAIAVSRTDDPQAAASGDNSAWMDPVIVSKQNSTLFSDKEQIWADNAASSPFFGNVYVCNAAFRSQELSPNAIAQPLMIATSRDGGDTWKTHQITAAAANSHTNHGFGSSGCTVRTDSHGVVYVFYYQFAVGFPGHGKQMVVVSRNGGRTWSRPHKVVDAVDLCNAFEPSIGRCVEDGVAGARDDLGPAPSVDIANGAPTGEGATNQIVDAWADGRDGLNHEHVMFTTSTDGGASWSAPRQIETPGDRGYYAAPSISPDGSTVYVVYNGWTTPFRDGTEGPGNARYLVGVVKQASVDTSTGAVGPFTEIHRSSGSPPGDARGSSQNNLAAEFLGDYVYSAATADYSVSVWNDVRNAADCPAIDTYRQQLHDYVVSGGKPAEAEEPGRNEDAPDDPTAPTPPPVEQVCPPNFGNSDIYAFSTAP